MKKSTELSLCTKISIFVGILLVLIGCFLVVIFDAVFIEVVKKQATVVPGTLMYNLNWYKVKTPVFRSFYLFNLTNKNEFLDQKPGNYVKPVFEEIGPYVYREYLSKNDITYFEYNQTYPEQVYFKQEAVFYFDSERSVGKEDDVITTLNFLVPFFAGVIEQVFEKGPALNLAYATLNQLIESTNTELLFTMSVREYLWGFEDPLLTALLDILFPDRDSNKFGLFLLTNVSAGWPDYRTYTGRGNYKLSNVISQFKNMSELPYWYGNSCNKINGTDGTFTQAYMNKDDPTYIYIDEMCRSVYCVYERDETVRKIQAWKYTMPGEIFYSPLKHPDNNCFCKEINHLLCQHDGALLLSSCLFNAPLAASFPHFLYGDGYYLSKLEGLQPNEEDHGTVLFYEPIIGLVLNATSKVQLNIYMYPHPKVNLLQTIDESFLFPMIWLDETAEIQEEDADFVYKLLYSLRNLVLLLQILLLVIGLIMFFISIYKVARVGSFCKKKENLPEEGENTNNGKSKVSHL